MNNNSANSGHQGSWAHDRNYTSGYPSDADRDDERKKQDRGRLSDTTDRKNVPGPLRVTRVEQSVSSAAGSSRPDYNKDLPPLPSSPGSPTSRTSSQGTGTYLPGGWSQGTHFGPDGTQINVNRTSGGLIVFNDRPPSVAATSPQSGRFPISPLSGRFSYSGTQVSPVSPSLGISDAARYYTLSEREREELWKRQSYQSQQGRGDSGGSGP